MEPIEYPEAFVAAVKAAFPYSVALHQALDNGSRESQESIGRFLENSCHPGIANEAVVGSNSLDSLKATAMAQMQQMRLYEWWKRLPKPSDG